MLYMSNKQDNTAVLVYYKKKKNSTYTLHLIFAH